MSVPDLLPGDLPLVRRRRDALRAQADQAVARFQTLSEEVGRAKARVDANESVQAVLSEMQRLGHARSVGVFERLLTALLKDVFPEERQVHLDLYPERGLPALDIYVSKTEGELEDTETGTGGGVTNGLSTGLRFISLARSSRRPFIVLDEPDCWMEEHRVPAFMQLIQQTAQQLGIQVLLISHHSDQLVSAIPHRLRLENGPKGLEIHWTPSSDIPTWEPDQPGLRGVRFEHCFGHTDTYLPLAPGVTLLRGSNDQGKSSLIATLNMVLEGKTKDSMIQHRQNLARVTLDFGPDKVVRFERRRNGSPKVRYELVDPALPADAEPLRRSTDGRNRPDWLLEVTGIGAVDDLNIQLTSQKNPVFLLDQTNTQRAKALAVGHGNESAFVQRMMALDKQEVQEARTRIKLGEKELERLHRQIQVLTPLLGPDTVAPLETVAQAWGPRRRAVADQRALVARWRQVQQVHQALAPLLTAVQPRAPAPSPATAWRQLWGAWRHVRRLVGPAQALASQERPAMPTAPQGAAWRAVQRRWQRAQAQRQRLAGLFAFSAPAAPTLASPVWRPLWQRWQRTQAKLAVLAQLPDSIRMPPRPTPLTEGAALHRRWTTLQTQVAAAQVDLEQADAQAHQLQTALEEVRHQMHGQDPMCPVCHRPWD
jgi:hypothetical protein